MKRKLLFFATAVALLAAFAVGAWIYTKRPAQAPGAATTAPADPAYTHLVRMHSPTLGKPDAKVQLVEFLDPACSACARFYPYVKDILAAHPDQVRLVLRFAPFHRGADAVVAVLVAARKQGKFWPALEALLASQASWVHQHTAQVGQVWPHLDGLGLDLDQLRADMGAAEIAREIAQDLADAKALGVNKTPQFFVNGKPLTQFGYEPLKAMIAEALGSAQP